jgi:hypothetical protein
MVGCQHNSNLLIFNIDPSDLGAHRVIQMQTEISYRDKSYAIESIVDISQENIKIIGTAAGVRIFTILYNGKEISDGPGIGMPFYFPSNLITEDILFILGKNEAIRSHLSSGYSLETTANYKMLLHNEKVIIKMDSSQNISGNSLVNFYRISPEYKLKILMIEVK